MSASMAPAYELRAALRSRAPSFRVKFCGLGTVKGDPEVVVRDFGAERRAHWRGVMLCGRQYACPVCAARRAAERAAELDAMMRADEGARWQMVTFTLRHHRGESLKSVLELLMGALRRVRSTRRVRQIFSARVLASVRALEVTFGVNGWHPHAHILLNTSDWTEAERAVLAEEWSRALPGRTEFDVAVVWSLPIVAWQASRARYIAKLGAELAGVGKLPKGGNQTPWQIARASLTDERAAALWSEYVAAMRGRRVLEFDERAKALAAAGSELLEASREWRVFLYREEYIALGALERRDPGVLWRVLEAAKTAGADPPSAVRDFVDGLLQRKAA